MKKVYSVDLHILTIDLVSNLLWIEVPVGFALFFHNFSTFVGKPGIYLEDLFVLKEYRGFGYGKKLLTHLAKLAKERDCGRYEWVVLDWNEVNHLNCQYWLNQLSITLTHRFFFFLKKKSAFYCFL